MGRMSDLAIEMEEESHSWDFDYEYDQYEAELKWFEEHPFLETYSIFREQLLHLLVMLKKTSDEADSEMMYKMAYVHAVTLFEAMVGDILKATVLAYPSLMQKMVSKLGEDKNNKFHITEIAELGLQGIVLGILDKQLYHNPVTVKKYVSLIAGKVMPDTHIAAMQDITERRHDFAHRNGKTIKGANLEINLKVISSSVEVIENFAQDIFETIDEAMKEESNSKML